MKKLLLPILALAGVLALSHSAHAQQAQVVATCGAASIGSGGTHALQIGTDGQLCTNASVASGTFDDASTSGTGSAVPADASYQGINVSGNLRGATGVNPTGSVFAPQVDIASIGGTVPASPAGTMPSQPVGYSYFHSAATGTTSKTSAVFLHTVCVNTLGTVASTVKVEDADTDTTPVLGIIDSLTTGGTRCYTYDAILGTGLTVVTTGNPDITVTYR